MKKGGLGRGMEALMGESFAAEALDTQIERDYISLLPVGQIDVNTSQPRKAFNKENLEALADSIRANGILQPITVRQVGSRYEIVAGERRFRACRLLKMETIPAIVKDLSPRQVSELSLIENIQREDLTPIEEASAIDALMHEYGLTQQVVSERIGLSRPAIANSLRLLKLPDDVQRMIAVGTLSAGHGRALAALDDTARQRTLARQAADENWSVRRIEQEVKHTPAKQPPRKPVRTDPDLARAEEAIRLRTGTRVAIKGTPKKGKIELSYYSRDDLERLISLLAPDAEL